MKELDQMKDLWQSQEIKKEYNKEDLRKQIQKKSSSVVRWIFIFSTLELAFWILSSYTNIFIKSTSEIVEKMSSWTRLVGYLQLVISLVFIYLFYRNYKNLSISSSIKKLMAEILKIRKIVKYYVIFNLLFLIIQSIEGIYFSLLFQSQDSGIPIHFSLKTIMVILISLFILFGIFFGFYILVYGRLLNKLNKNYIEIQNIDFDE